MDDRDYNNLSRPKLAFVIILLIGIPVFALRFYLISLENGKIVEFRNKFKVVHLERNCNWSPESNFVRCFKKDFLNFVRKQTYYEGILAYELFLKIKEHDYLKQTTETGRILSTLDSFEVMLSFFEINRNKSINRNKADWISLTFSYLKKEKPISHFHQSEEALFKLGEEHEGFFEAKPVLKNRYGILKKRYLALKKDLKDS